MSTTHVFIVDNITFKYHLEYLFVGTGSGDDDVNFLNSSKSIHHTTENKLLAMIADSQRIRKGDFVIFYLQKNSQSDGKFYGLFKIKSERSFLDHNDDKQYLYNKLEKSLTFRAFIEPYKVYANGVTEWEALDEINGIQLPCQMQWSLIYRKLKGNRGNTMITINESDRLVKLIENKNNKKTIPGSCFTFDKDNQSIILSSSVNEYKGRREPINILHRLNYKYNKRNKFESHLQAYIVQNVEKIGIFNNDKIEWLGNEVSCGVGMQRIDVMLSIAGENRKVVPIELKSDIVYHNITVQLQRYIDWLEQYYIPNRASEIEPMIISMEYPDKSGSSYKDFITNLNSFNKKNKILKTRYVEFSIKNKSIIFNQVDY
ncbi:MAG: hypothetical protein FWD47_13850 [Treponema sp.]|nr:hypothetical protein [Treponema sp.]